MGQGHGKLLVYWRLIIPKWWEVMSVLAPVWLNQQPKKDLPDGGTLRRRNRVRFQLIETEVAPSVFSGVGKCPILGILDITL